jgi:two-component system cell cycle sensor histidine kinase/response regulator CckA
LPKSSKMGESHQKFAPSGAAILEAPQHPVLRNPQVHPAARNSLADKYQILFNESSFCCLVYDAQTLSIVAVNDTAVQHYGYSRQEFLKKTMYDICISEEESTSLISMKNSLLKPGTAGRSVHRKKDDTLIEVEIINQPVEFEGRKAMYAAVLDMTERRRAESELKESEERFRQLAENIQEVFWLSDLHATQTFYISPSYEHVWGRTCQSMYQDPKSFLEAIHPEDRPRVLAAVQNMTQGIHQEYRIIQPGGAIRWILARGFPIADKDGKAYRIAGIATDITDRKLAELEIKDREAQLEAFFDASPFGMVIMDQDLRYQKINEPLARMNGVSVREHIGRHIREVIPKVAPAVEGVFRKVLVTGRPLFNAEIRGETPRQPGVERVWMEYIFPFKNPGKINPDAVGAIVVEITDQKQLEEQLRQAQKTEALGHLAGSVAHDFNNILTVMKGYVDLILPRLRSKDQSHEDLLEVKRAVQQGTNLTHQLLAFSRKEVLQPKSLDLNRILKSMSNIIQHVIGENIELTCRLEPSLPLMQGDQGQVEQIVMNLVVNARDAMPGGGRLTIETSSRGPATHAQILLSVRDTGKGMEPATLAHLFEPFFTTKPQGRGTGLGLNTVNEIVRQMGGRIEVKSEVGQGTTLLIEFAGFAREVNPHVRRNHSPRSLTGTETILIAEDDSQIRPMLQRALSQKGYIALSAREGGQALAIFQHHPTRIDLIITDMNMPRMGGEELASAVNRTGYKSKILYMSGHTENIGLKKKFLKHGTAFIQKPFSINDLLTSVRQLLDS